MCNPMVDLSKFTSNKKILSKVVKSSNSVKYTMNVQTPKNKITNSSFMTNNKCAENEHKL